MRLIGYVTLAEANEYVSTHYLSNDPLRTSWEDLFDEDQEVLLTQSFQALELLPFTGRKLNPEQHTAFPRWPYKEVPEAVKWAQIEHALARSDASAVEDERHYAHLRAQGVESYSIGNLSEQLGSSVSGPRVSAKAELLLRPYLGGGYRM